MRRLILLSAIISFLSGSFAQSAFAGDRSLEQALVESAGTAEEHAALAHYYERKAAGAHKSAEYHRAMAKSYGGAKGAQIAEMKSHCDKLATLSEEEAKEFEAMASVQRGLAK